MSEGLNFLEVLLGDKPALTPAQSFYQRALIGDSAEALVDYLDEVALAGLKLAERDAGSLDAENLESIDATVAEMMHNLTDFEPRRWFRKVRTEVEVDEAPGGLASQLAGVLQRQGLKARALPSDRPLTSFRLKPPRRSSFASLISARARAQPMSAISCGDCGGAYCLRPPRFWSAFGRTKEVGPRSRRWRHRPKPMPMSPR
jgi:hypothetical protein